MAKFSWHPRLNRASDQFFRSMPLRAKALLYAGIFFCFAPLGLLQDAMALRIAPVMAVVVQTAYAGGVAAFTAWIMLNHARWFLVPVALLFAGPFALDMLVPSPPAPTALDATALATVSTRLRIVTMLSMACMASAYVTFLALVQREGLRYSRAHAEIKLAREIHATLVPDVQGQDQELTWRGRSRPSGDVGGDLVDVVPDASAWWATVSDVSGHGVAAGVLMGMFKTAFHSAVNLQGGERQDSRNIANVVTRVNHVISPLRQPNMFITTACLHQVSPGRFDYVLAGHPSMLHISRGGTSSRWVGTSQLALGLLETFTYTSGSVTLEAGDVLVLVTDGLIEVFDRNDRELGLDGLQAAATAAAQSGSLEDIERAMFEACAAHGKQLDDQTTLLVKFR